MKCGPTLMDPVEYPAYFVKVAAFGRSELILPDMEFPEVIERHLRRVAVAPIDLPWEVR